MKQELKKLANVLALLVLSIAMIPLKAGVVMFIAKMFNLEFITQFSFVQLIGTLIVINFIKAKIELKEVTKEATYSDNWKELGLRLVHIVLAISLSYIFFNIFN